MLLCKELKMQEMEEVSYVIRVTTRQCRRTDEITPN